MPVVHPADVWRASGRYDAIGPELGRFKDRNGRDMVLAMTHEEVVGDAARRHRQVYRQLPMQVYHFQTKWRDEPRARGGLIRVREFVMKDAYSCDRDEAGLDASYWAQHGAYVRTFERLGLDAIAVRADVGMMGGSRRPRVHGPERGRRGRPRPVRGVRLRREPAGRGHHASPSPRPRTRCRSRRSRRPATTTIATLGGVPRRRRGADGQGRVLRHRRRAARDRHRARRPRGQRDEARQRRQGAPAASGRRRSRRSRPPAWSPATARRSAPRDAIVVVDDARRALAEPRRRARTARASTTATSTSARDLHARRRRRHHQRPGGRSLPDLRLSR